MRKEVLLAIFIGLGLGLFITYGVYQARLSLNNPDPKPSINGAAARLTTSLVSHIATPTLSKSASMKISAAV